MRDLTILRCADFLVSEDLIIWNPPSNGWAHTWRTVSRGIPNSPLAEGPLLFSPAAKWSATRIIGRFSRLPAGPIFLVDSPDTGIMRPLWEPLLIENILHWSKLLADRHTDQGVWITTYNMASHTHIAQIISRILSPDGGNVAMVDVSQTRSSFWPLVRGLVSASAEYREELGIHTPRAFESTQSDLVTKVPRRRRSPYDLYDASTFIQELLCQPLEEMHQKATSNRKVLHRTTIIVHGVRYPKQADELYTTIETLRKKLPGGSNSIGIVMISTPLLLRRVLGGKVLPLHNICSLYVSDSTTIYSGSLLTPTTFYQNLFLLLEESIHCIGGNETERLYNKLKEISSLTDTHVPDDATHSTLSLFSTLNTASATRRSIFECFSALENVSRTRINDALIKDNLKIARVLQLLFEIKSYKQDLPALPRHHALAVLNLTHYILDVGLAETDAIPNYDVFLRRTHSLLNRLAAYLNLLPDEIAITGVVLLGDHVPVKHGGFSNVYHGMYTNAAGEQVEVALKVLKIFQDQSDADRHVMHTKFSKEALVWHYFRHKNIVPFLGVDFTTFPSPARAMVSPWMSLGSVLKYMGENSPSAPYALELFCDVINGLEYLHSMNIVHGDLCGRNILMDNNGHACLTDFGLTAFVESETTLKVSTRGGSPRFMAPELLLLPSDVHFTRKPPSDIWSFGCVCCEIWSEGHEPFRHVPTDGGVVFFLAGSPDGASPYPSTPQDKVGNYMPKGVWELLQRCWKLEPAERPDAKAISQMLSEMSGASERPALRLNHQRESPVASGSASPTNGSLPLVLKGNEGKQRASVEGGYSTVVFGPLDVDGGDPEEIFAPIFNGLKNFVRGDALVEPLLVDEQDSESLVLRFRSVVDAHNFAMTWTVHRFEPYQEVLATLVRHGPA
ncbi:kinase-like domain-containing protein [Mycena sanguinolenta]|nr:kinase-like domain-containing protein [Mycena sanguinolenta]